MDINNNFKNTVSSKMYKCSMLTKHFYTKILESQKIRRYMYYTTTNPLSQNGKGYDGSRVPQPDVTESQVEGIITDLPFHPEMDLELENNIFINLPLGDYNNKSDISIDVNLIVPIEYYRVSSGYRHYEIGCEIANIIADKYVDGEYVGELGDGMKIKFLKFECTRLSKSNNHMWMKLQFKISNPPFDRVRP